MLKSTHQTIHRPRLKINCLSVNLFNIQRIFKVVLLFCYIYIIEGIREQQARILFPCKMLTLKRIVIEMLENEMIFKQTSKHSNI